MNMLEFEREIARRTLSFLDNKTTDMADHILEDPVSVYSDPELFEEEKRLLFNRYPIFVGLTCDLPEPGSWKTYDASGTPILLTRADDGQVHALLNICQHRGSKVVDGPCGEGARRFTCPFHAWTYDIQGRLVGVPGAEGFNEMRRQERGLIELPVEEKYGLIFCAAHPDAHFSLDEHLGPELAAQLESFGFETWKPLSPVHPHRMRCNWKVSWGTHCETYHFGYLHRNSVGDMMYGNTSCAYEFGDHALMTQTVRTIDKLRDLPEDQWYPLKEGMISLSYRMFPNVSFSVVFGDRLEIYTPFPGDSIHDTVSLHYAYGKELPDSEQEREELAQKVLFACKTVVDDEDFRVAERTEPWIHSPSMPKTLVFGRNEPVMQHMALKYRDALGLAANGK